MSRDDTGILESLLSWRFLFEVFYVHLTPKNYLSDLVFYFTHFFKSLGVKCFFKNADLWIGNVFSTTLLYRWKHNLKINAEIKCCTLTFLSWCFCLLFCIHRNTLEGKIWVNYISWWTLVVTFHKWSICYPGTVWWVWWKALLMQHLHQYNVPNTCIWFMKEVKSAPVSEWFSPRKDLCWKPHGQP